MSKRSSESDAEYKARKKAKKEKKLKKESKKKRKAKKRSEESDNTTTDTDAEKEKSSSPNNDELVASWESFADAPFAEPIQKALQVAGYSKPSPIQSRAWPVAMSGNDLIAVAKTGSGKTLGFLLPVLHRISSSIDGSSKKEGRTHTSEVVAPLCIILSPTRELAIQIHGVAVKFASCLNNIQCECVYGGTNVQSQCKQLKASNPQILIATPGRLCDLLERDVLSLSSSSICILVSLLVNTYIIFGVMAMISFLFISYGFISSHTIYQDEADRMLDMGFEKQITSIMKVLPTDRQTLFFTATWPKAVRRMASKYLRERETSEVFIGGSGDGELAANKAVTQSFIESQDDEKDKKLYNILCGMDAAASVVIFANTKRRVDYVTKAFWEEGFATVAVHGDKPQHERDRSLKKFINKEVNILVATDVAARGLDIKGVTHVINFDMARDVESYVHRIGRTGRAGELGQSITFWNPDYDKDCSPALVVIAKKAGQEVPPFLKKYEKVNTSKQWRVATAEKVTAELLKGSLL